jgi:hypothetical protein
MIDSRLAMPLKRTHLLISVILLLLPLLLISTPLPAHADAPQPTLAVGNHWTYGLTATSGTLSISATLTLTIVDEETITVSGNTYDAFRIISSGSGSAIGPTLTAAITVSGYSLARHSDFADIQDLVTTSFTFSGQTLTQIQTTTNTPPTLSGKFPLSVGETWSYTTTTVTNTTTIPPVGLPSTRITTNTTSTTAVVLNLGLTTVPAGTYDTYLVRSSSSTGSQQTYYSPEVMQPIKQVSYNSTGIATSTLQLQSYNAWPFSTNLAANRGGTNYNIVVQTDVGATALVQNPTTITFKISGNDTVTGRANVTIPQKFNTTNITVQVDGTTTTTTTLKDSANYYVFFTLTLSTHTITLTYASSSFPWFLILGILGAVAAVVIVSVFILLKRRKPATEIPPTTPGPAPTTIPGPSPPPPQ